MTWKVLTWKVSKVGLMGVDSSEVGCRQSDQSQRISRVSWAHNRECYQQWTQQLGLVVTLSAAEVGLLLMITS